MGVLYKALLYPATNDADAIKKKDGDANNEPMKFILNLNGQVNKHSQIYINTKYSNKWSQQEVM